IHATLSHRTSTLSLHDALPISRELLEYNNNEVSAIEIALQAGSNEKAVMKKISQLIGDDYLVQNKDLQHAFLYKITQSEKLITRSEEHTSELQSRENLVCRLLL